MVLRRLGDKKPSLAKGAYVDVSAQVIGDVRLREGASVWPGAVVRADDDFVEIGRGSAVLDLAFAEAPKGKPVRVGEGCIVSHGARLHGCTIGDKTMIGVGAIVLDNAVVGEGCVVAAGSLVPPGAMIPRRSLAMGLPAKVVRATADSDMKQLDEELVTLARKAAKYAALE